LQDAIVARPGLPRRTSSEWAGRRQPAARESRIIDRIIDNNIDQIVDPLHDACMNAAVSAPPELESALPEAEASAAQIVEGLEEDIVFGRVHPRERLIENDLMDRFGAKRHVVRQALAELERIGLAERLPGRSVTVRDLTPEEVEKIYAMRELLETAAARWMPLPADRELLAELTRIQREHDAAAARRDLRALFRINIDFHDALFSHCGNRYLVDEITLFGKKAHAVRSLSITRTEATKGAGRDHWEIIRALREGDRKALVAVCRDHIQVAKNAYIEAYRERFPATPRPA
jgi:DNA-binding GntR family transcriptional regulator